MHRHPALALHALDQRAAAARHDDVDQIGHAEHQADRGAIAGRHELDAASGQAGGGEPAAQAGRDRRARSGSSPSRRAGSRRCRLAGTAPPASAVTFGRDFVDDADDAERHAHARDVEAVGPRPARQLGADRIGQARRRLEPCGHRLDALARRAAAGRASRADRPCAARAGHVLGVGGEDRGRGRAHGGRGIAQRRGSWRAARRGPGRCGRRPRGQRRSSPHLALEVRRAVSAGLSVMAPSVRHRPSRRGGSSRPGRDSRGSARSRRSCGPAIAARVGARIGREPARRARARRGRGRATASPRSKRPVDRDDAGRQQARAVRERRAPRRRRRRARPRR